MAKNKIRHKRRAGKSGVKNSSGFAGVLKSGIGAAVRVHKAKEAEKASARLAKAGYSKEGFRKANAKLAASGLAKRRQSPTPAAIENIRRNADVLGGRAHVIKVTKSKVRARYKAPRQVMAGKRRAKAPSPTVRTQGDRVIVPKRGKGERVRIDPKTGLITATRREGGRLVKVEFFAPKTWAELDAIGDRNPGKFEYTLVMPRADGHERFRAHSPQELFKIVIAGSAALRRAQDNLAKSVEITEAEEGAEYDDEPEEE